MGHHKGDRRWMQAQNSSGARHEAGLKQEGVTASAARPLACCLSWEAGLLCHPTLWPERERGSSPLLPWSQ